METRPARWNNQRSGKAAFCWPYPLGHTTQMTRPTPSNLLQPLRNCILLIATDGMALCNDHFCGSFWVEIQYSNPWALVSKQRLSFSKKNDGFDPISTSRSWRLLTMELIMTIRMINSSYFLAFYNFLDFTKASDFSFFGHNLLDTGMDVGDDSLLHLHRVN